MSKSQRTIVGNPAANCMRTGRVVRGAQRLPQTVSLSAQVPMLRRPKMTPPSPKRASVSGIRSPDIATTEPLADDFRLVRLAFLVTPFASEAPVEVPPTDCGDRGIY